MCNGDEQISYTFYLPVNTLFNVFLKKNFPYFKKCTTIDVTSNTFLKLLFSFFYKIGQTVGQKTTNSLKAM